MLAIVVFFVAACGEGKESPTKPVRDPVLISRICYATAGAPDGAITAGIYFDAKVAITWGDGSVCYRPTSFDKAKPLSKRELMRLFPSLKGFNPDFVTILHCVDSQVTTAVPEVIEPPKSRQVPLPSLPNAQTAFDVCGLLAPSTQPMALGSEKAISAFRPNAPEGTAQGSCSTGGRRPDPRIGDGGLTLIVIGIVTAAIAVATYLELRENNQRNAEKTKREIEKLEREKEAADARERAELMVLILRAEDTLAEQEAARKAAEEKAKKAADEKKKAEEELKKKAEEEQKNAPAPTTTSPAGNPSFLDPDVCREVQQFIWDCSQGGWRSAQCIEFVRKLRHCGKLSLINPGPEGSLYCETSARVGSLDREVRALKACRPLVNPSDPNVDPCDQRGSLGGTTNDEPRPPCKPEIAITEGNGCPTKDPPPDLGEDPVFCPEPLPKLPPVPCFFPPPKGPMPPVGEGGGALPS